MLPGLIPDIKKLLELCETEQKKPKKHTNMHWNVPYNRTQTYTSYIPRLLVVAKKNLFIHIPQQRRLCRWDSSRGRSWGLLLLVAAVVSSHLLMTSSKTCQAATNDQQRHTVVAFSEGTLGGPPTRLISWFINSMHTIVVSITQHTCWSCVHQLSYRKRGPHFVVVENQINGWSPYSPLKWRFFWDIPYFQTHP